ncbi:hypothetical protein CIHG_04302 [Coccidioides immitis H538.4]|uniref:Uncharacterized protein n=3 Tax=Coccidioides immitis TaxID=5501 RepID=A0A0J8R8C3_COCIT|nr:hypothetical protein CIRG_09235 [Coccidioides immitis RMSCC 2394]KMU81106.1 hypothetical protein CISG_02484 [Coccidioides immitis RMSCC 3703]KMU86513.1 hypothetical protein CIHG_04302 [Coccidioides immitis H538.4]
MLNPSDLLIASGGVRTSFNIGITTGNFLDTAQPLSEVSEIVQAVGRFLTYHFSRAMLSECFFFSIRDVGGSKIDHLALFISLFSSWAMKGSTFSAHQVVAVDLGIAFLVASVGCYRNRATVVGFDKLDDLEPFGDAIVIEANGGRPKISSRLTKDASESILFPLLVRILIPHRFSMNMPLVLIELTLGLKAINYWESSKAVGD